MIKNPSLLDRKLEVTHLLFAGFNPFRKYVSKRYSFPVTSKKNPKKTFKNQHLVVFSCSYKRSLLMYNYIYHVCFSQQTRVFPIETLETPPFRNFRGPASIDSLVWPWDFIWGLLGGSSQDLDTWLGSPPLDPENPWKNEGFQPPIYG